MSAGERVRVVVTGLGATTALGGDVASTWEAMLRGESGVGLIDDPEWVGKLPTELVARARVDPLTEIEPALRKRLGRTEQLAVVAAGEAWKDAGLDTAGVDPDRVSVVISSGITDMNAVIGGYDALRERGWKRVPPMTVASAMGNGSAAAVSMLVNAHGGANATVNACSSGTQALATAADLIRRGLADVVVAGGAESPLHPFLIASFGAMRAVSVRMDDPAAASRPFDADRDGLVLGEGAGILILESAEHARRRGARAHAELAGVGISSDAFHLVQPAPDGSGSITAITVSLDDAGVSPSDIAFLSANGTSTTPGDASEAVAVQSVFGDASVGPAVTANKSMLGHTLGAAGAIESIITILGVKNRIVPETLNFTRADEGVSLDVVHDGPRELKGEEIVAVKNSAGFGGHNVALVFREVPAP
ncbi:beta-ketoacyl-[acyl-carrier-protein] synthase family protein [Kineosporia sp. J2-2]|uniref:Beta-ketoacyl-[acyl-carrier-protein] synthase family protein n=1 Tax=Kineosporia corallincola TaxID=2835133 RepID=A0ABS5TP11_9ACTN|nr:beta-ketoacyl-[acyl-carrier-protein] synthase family protein [Kineosporia corallincola]MBT0772832.1 beta-ketoacyl-[acyl-carrier-protein] synthase family protein [Kineosporia corallincola]